MPDSYQHYLDTNLQFISAYRQFNRNIPDYLHNRPTHFVKHCLKSKFAAGEYDQCDVKCVNFGKGEFMVRSCSSSNWLFAVKLLEPSCQCESWRRTHFPWKHFFAVFKFFEEWDFNTLPLSYRNSVFITLDNGDVTNCNPTEELPSQPCASEDCSDGSSGYEHNPEDGEATSSQFHGTAISSDEDEETDRFHTPPSHPKISVTAPPPQISNATKTRRRLQGRIDALRSATFMVDDANVLENITAVVETLLTQLQKSSPHQNGLPPRQSPAKKKLKVTEVDFHKVFHKTLPGRRRRTKKRKDRGDVVDLCKTDTPEDNPLVISEEVGCFIFQGSSNFLTYFLLAILLPGRLCFKCAP